MSYVGGALPLGDNEVRLVDGGRGQRLPAALLPLGGRSQDRRLLSSLRTLSERSSGKAVRDHPQSGGNHARDWKHHSGFLFSPNSQFCPFVRKLFDVISLFRCEHLTCQVKYYGVNGSSTQQWLTIKMLLSLALHTRLLMPWRMTALLGRFNFKF